MFLIPNNKVACEPFPSLAIEKQGTKGFVTAKQKTTLSATKVVYAPMMPLWNQQPAASSPLNWLTPGNTVFVRGDAILNFGREVYSFGEDGPKFILVPFDYIMAVEQGDYVFPLNLNPPYQQVVNIPLGGQLPRQF